MSTLQRVRVVSPSARVSSTLRRTLSSARFRIEELADLDELEDDLREDPARPPVVIVPYARAVREAAALSRWAARVKAVFVLVPEARRREAHRVLPVSAVHLVLTPLQKGQLEAELERVGSAPLEESLTPALARVRGISGIPEPPRMLDSIFVETITAIMQGLGCRRASILLLDDDHGDLIVHGSVLSRGRRIRSHVKLARRGGVTRRILEGRRPLLVRDATRELGEALDGTGEYESGSFVAVPIFLSDHLTMVLNAADPAGTGSFDESHLALIEKIGHRLTKLLESAGGLLPLLRHAARAQVDALARKEQDLAIDGLKHELSQTRADLERRSLEFEAVHEVSQALKGTFVLEELSRMIIQVITRVLDAERASLLLIDDEQGDLLLRGAVGFREDTTGNIRLTQRGPVTRRILEAGRPMLSHDLEADLKIPRRTHLGYRTGAFMAAPVKINGVTRAIINVSERRSAAAFTERDLSLLALLANQVAVALENYFLSQALVERERLEKELQIAQRIQAKVLPTSFQVSGRVRIAASSSPAKEVGGDYYDCFALDDGSVGVAIGDVSGKGMPAALVMMMLRSLLRVQAQHLGAPDRLIEALSRLLEHDLESHMFITLFVAQLDAASGRLRYSNAGHCPPYIVRQVAGRVEPLAMPDAEPIGLFGAVTCTETTARLAPGDKLVCYTDGVIEAERSRGDLFGTDRFESVLARHAASSPEVLIDAVRAEVQAFMEGRPPSDDVSVVVVELVPDLVSRS